MIKVILVSISATLLIVAFVSSIFLNSILGVFGLASTSIQTLNNLQESKQIIDKVKTRHKSKKLNASSKFAKRTGRRIAASAVSAATIGTAAVVVAIATFEIFDYCEDKEEIHNDENLLFKSDEKFDFNACLNEATDDSEKIIASIKNAVPEVVESTWEETKNISNNSWEATKSISIGTWNSTKSLSLEAWDATKNITSDSLSSTSETTEKIWRSLIDWDK